MMLVGFVQLLWLMDLWMLMVYGVYMDMELDDGFRKQVNGIRDSIMGTLAMGQERDDDEIVDQSFGECLIMFSILHYI